MAGAGGRGGGRGDGDDAGDTDDGSTLARRRRRHACAPARAREEMTSQERDSALSGTRTPHCLTRPRGWAMGRVGEGACGLVTPRHSAETPARCG
eukprot:5709274-Pleurochrysis_carterae.AAC.1